MTIYLRYDKSFVCDRNKFLEQYTTDSSYKMLKSAPILFCVEGTYIKLESLIDVSPPRYRNIVSQFVYNVKNCILPKQITFKWKRTNY